jgi:hypothetical protein
MNLNYSKGKKENATVEVGSAYGASQAGPARSSRTSFGAVGRKKLNGRMTSVRCGRPELNGGGGRRPGVVVGSTRCGKVVHDSMVLGVWSRRTERGWNGLSMVA